MPSGQPAAGTPRIGFIGAGQLGVALAWSLARAGYRVIGAASRSQASAARLAGGIAECRAYDSAQHLVDDADLIVIAVPDDAIASATRSLAWRERHAVIHCSGATEVLALAAAAAQGASIGGFHPLQTFTNTEAAIKTLPGCTVGIEAEEPLLGQLTEMAKALGCHPIRLPAGARALYHASGSFAASFLVGLINDALALWSAFGVEREDAFRALLPLTKGTVAALEANGPIRSLAGPIARADVGTVERHIAALRAHAPALLPTYLDLARRSLPIADAKGGASREKLNALRALLDRVGP
ncbi:MAG: DUF2520 domain-containing protein [Hyphomonadaceae bacterium]|nr:DUF2520 domain-containing protein [Hyphomonadaceae bacterium]